MESGASGEVEKTLYMLSYQYGRSLEASSYKLTFFYAADAIEARQKANEKLRKFVGPTREIGLRALPTGFKGQRIEMQGKMVYNADGTVKTPIQDGVERGQPRNDGSKKY
jgi:hypothetical protein